MSSIALLPSHAHPHSSPLRMENRLDDPRDLINQGQAAVHMVENLHFPRRLPWHGHVFQQLEHRMWHKLQRAEIAALVAAEFLLRHVSDILHDLS